MFKILKNDDEVQLYMKNKTQFFKNKRTNLLRQSNIYYNESKLITFQDKLNYLIIHESPEYKSNFADKIKLRQYSKKIIGKDICVPILKIYDNANEIDFNDLPNKFVLKLNHGSGMNILCKNKSKLNITEAKTKLNEWKNINYGLISHEYQYLFIKKKIFASPYLCDNIIDYEVWCFNGKPKFIRTQKLINENNNTILHNWYDLNWKLTDIETGLKPYIRIPSIFIDKPKNLNLMLYYSKQLSKEFAFVRIDFYEFNNTLYLSEMTFSPSNCRMKFKNKEQSIYLGNLLDISKIKTSLYNK